VCNGEPCVELYKDDCVLYTGPNFPCLNVQTNERLESVLIKIMTKLTQCCCDGTPQPVDCVVSEWGPWSECIDGVQTRTRTVVTPASNGGDPCPALEETRECCEPVDCVVSEWSEWTECIDNVRSRTRTVITPASCGGVECPALVELEECDPGLPVNCQVSDWSNWSECVDGTRTRTRTILIEASNGGTPCPPLVETQSCSDCVVSDWGPWSDCIDGEQTRTRTVITPATNGGAPCPPLTETQDCLLCGEIEEGWVTIDAPDCPSIGFLYNVNIPASATWAEGSDINITVYETGTLNLLSQASLTYSAAPTNSTQWTFDQSFGGGLIDPINMNLSGTQITLNMTMNCGDTVKQKTLTYTVTDCPEGCTTPTGLSAQTLG
jgi:hypothetical protein